MALGNNVWPAGVPFDWAAWGRVHATQEAHYKKLQPSKASVQEPTEPGSGSPETKEQSIVMAEISYPTDANGSPSNYRPDPAADRLWWREYTARQDYRV